MKALLLDYDGTLNDSDSIFFTKLDGLFGRSGRELMALYMRVHREIVHKLHEDRHQDVDFHISLLLRELGLPETKANHSRIRRRFTRAQEACFAAQALFEDARAFLEHLRSRPFRVFLTTGEHARQKAQGLERLTGRNCFDDVFDDERVGVLKGHRDFFRRVLEATQTRPEEALVIGDSPAVDIAPAKALGMRACWVNRDGTPFPDNGIAPDLEVRTLTELLPHL